MPSAIDTGKLEIHLVLHLWLSTLIYLLDWNNLSGIVKVIQYCFLMTNVINDLVSLDIDGNKSCNLFDNVHRYFNIIANLNAE